MSSILIKDLKLSFGSVEVLKDLNIDIEEGQRVSNAPQRSCKSSHF